MTILTGSLIATTFHPSNQTVGLWVQRDDVDFAEIVNSLARRLVMVSITHLDPDMVLRHAELETVDYIETARVAIASSWADYWAARRNLKDNARKGRNKLARASIPTRLEVVRDAKLIGVAVDDYGLLESAGWKGTNAVHPGNAQGRYYRELFATFAARGMASVWRYFYGDKLVATDLCIHRDGTLIVLKTTYDENERTTSPSQLMRQEMFEQLFSDAQTRVIEFYGRAMTWHRGWTDEIRTMYHVNAYRSRVARQLVDAARRLKQRVRHRGNPQPLTATPVKD